MILEQAMRKDPIQVFARLVSPAIASDGLTHLCPTARRCLQAAPELPYTHATHTTTMIHR